MSTSLASQTLTPEYGLVRSFFIILDDLREGRAEDPRRELANLGYAPPNREGFEKALENRDVRAVNLFFLSGFSIDLIPRRGSIINASDNLLPILERAATSGQILCSGYRIVEFEESSLRFFMSREQVEREQLLWFARAIANVSSGRHQQIVRVSCNNNPVILRMNEELTVLEREIVNLLSIRQSMGNDFINRCITTLSSELRENSYVNPVEPFGYRNDIFDRVRRLLNSDSDFVGTSILILQSYSIIQVITQKIPIECERVFSGIEHQIQELRSMIDTISLAVSMTR